MIHEMPLFMASSSPRMFRETSPGRLNAPHDSRNVQKTHQTSKHLDGKWQFNAA